MLYDILLFVVHRNIHMICIMWKWNNLRITLRPDVSSTYLTVIGPGHQSHLIDSISPPPLWQFKRRLTHCCRRYCCDSLYRQTGRQPNATTQYPFISFQLLRTTAPSIPYLISRIYES